MPLATINKIWASDTNNRLDFNENQKAQGIEYQGPIISNQLNGIEFLNQTYIDNLQRSATSWNPSKIYKNGDCVIILAQYKNENIILILKSLKDNNSTAPLQKLDSIDFNINYDLAVVLFAINDNENDRQISYYLNNANWIILKNDQIIAEQKRALIAENNLSNEIKNEADRAKLAEQNLKNNLDDEINRAKLAEQAIENNISAMGKIISLEVKDHIISTAFVGSNYEVDLEAIVEANSTYKKGQFKIKSCQFIPNLTAASAVSIAYVRGYPVTAAAYLSFDKSRANFTLLQNSGEYVTSKNYSGTPVYGAYYSYCKVIMGTYERPSATAIAAFSATATAIATAPSAPTATATATSAFSATATTTVTSVFFPTITTVTATAVIIYEVWNSDKTLLIDRLTLQGYLSIGENQKLIIQNSENNCQSRTMGGTFYFQLEIGQ